MAAKKRNGLVLAAEVVGGLIILVYVYRLLFAKKVSAASGSGVTGPNLAGYGGTATYPYQTTKAANSTGNSILGALLDKLLKGSSTPGGGGAPGGGASGSSAGGAAKTAQTQQQLQQELKNIASYSSQANNASNPDLGGYSLLSLPVGYGPSGVDLSGYSIPNVSGGHNTFDFGTSGFSPSDTSFTDSTPWASIAGYQDYSWSNPIDTSSIDLGGIASQDMQTFDFGSNYY